MKNIKFSSSVYFLLVLSVCFFTEITTCWAQYPEYVPINPYLRQYWYTDFACKFFEFDNAESVKDWIPLSNIELAWKNDIIDTNSDTSSSKISCLEIKATGFDPYFASPRLDIPDEECQTSLKGPVGIILKMRRTEEGTGQIFWSEKDAPEWDEERSVSFPIKASNNFEYYSVLIEPQSDLRHIRLDIGSDKGTAEIDFIYFSQHHYLPVEISAYEIKDDQLDLKLTNHNESPAHWNICVQKEILKDSANIPNKSTDSEDASEKNNATEFSNDSPLEIVEETQIIDVGPLETVSFQTHFPKQKPFEKITVTILDQNCLSNAQQQNEKVIRHFYAFHSDLETDWQILKNEFVEIQFATDGSGARIFQNGTLAATIYPLIEAHSQKNSFSPITGNQYSSFDSDTIQISSSFGNGSPSFSSDSTNPSMREMIRFDSRTANQQLTLTSCNDQSVQFDFQFEDSKTRQLMKGNQIEFKLDKNELQFKIHSDIFVYTPNLHVFGTMKQALLSGVEYLEEGEHSSSTADIETKEHRRFCPEPLTLTMPFMSIITDRGSFSLLYENPKHQVLFATPNFLDGQAQEHRMSLSCGKDQELFGSNQSKEENQNRVKSSSLSIEPDSETIKYLPQEMNQLNGIIRICPTEPLENAILWAIQKRGLPKLPPRPRTQDEQDALNLFGLMESDGRAKNGAWFHAILPGATKNPFKPLYGSDFVSTIWELTGTMPEIPQLDKGGGHIRNYASFLLTNRGEELLQWLNSEASHLRNSQAPDGSFPYSGQFLKGHWDKTASGHCGNSLFRLFEHWRLTGNQDSLNAGLKGLEFVNQLKTPRGAQVWELSLHTPDIMGASRCCLANIFAYEATQKPEYLLQAKRWAITGMPFVYQWDAFLFEEEKNDGNFQNDENEQEISTENASEKVMLYATTPVFGATHWIKPNWIGLPVQWCGLDYAYALILLSQYDHSTIVNSSNDNATTKKIESGSKYHFPETPDWKKIAEGIIISAEQQQYTAGKSKGLFPDSFSLKDQNRHPFDINPTALHFLRRLLENRFTNIAVLVDSEKKHRILSPFPAKIDGNEIIIEAKKGMTYQIIIDGKTVQTIQSQGIDRVSF
ncbi:MAG: hypothetical protein Q4C95_09050 [Planctomycetia bacterium]|nr:hypothetical protein [Planctomycetia bacterium]